MTYTPEDAALEGFELSPQQAALWRLQHTGLAPAARWATLRIRSAQTLHSTRLKASLQQLLERHEILRTRYRQLPGLALPMQVIGEPGAVTPADWQALDIDLQLAADGHTATLRLPSLHVDSSSLGYLAQEWAAGYLQAAPDAPALQYADYAAWRQELADEAQGQAFWQEQLATRVTDANLPWQRQGGAATAAIEIDQLPVPLDPATWQQLEQQAAALGIEPATWLLGAWATLWQRHSEAEQLTLAYEQQARPDALGDALGLFGEALPLTLDTAPAQGFETLCRQLHERTTLLDAARDSYPSHLGSTPALTAVGFRHLADTPTSALDDATWQVELADSTSAACALLLTYQRQPGHNLTLHYDTTRYSEAHAQLLAEQVLSLIAHSLREPATALGQLTTCSAAEQQRVCGDLAAAPALSASQQQCYAQTCALPNLAACFAQAAGGDRPAVSGPSGSLSHAELEQRVTALTQHLLAQGLAPGTRIAHFLPRDLDAVVALVAILRAGACYVPVDPSYPLARIDHILADSQAQWVLTQRDQLAALPQAWQPRALLIDELPPTTTLYAEPSISREQPAYLIYTSGSTGQPKGVVISHGNALHSLAARLAGYPQPVERFLLLSSFAFDSSIAGLFWSLAQGGCLHLASETEQKDPQRLAQLIRDHGVTHLLALPSLYALLLDALGGTPSSLGIAIVAGESCPAALVAAHHRLQPAAQLYNEYGPTEASVWSSVAHCTADNVQGSVPIGRAIAHTRLYLLDEQGAPVARGLKGEIHIAGPGLSSGYLGLPEMTAQKFVQAQHPALAGQRLYRTGDYAWQDMDGTLRFLGRSDSQVKLRGYRIELGEVERALCTVSGARLATVLLDTNQAEPSLRAFVELAAPAQAERLREALAQHLPAHMIPSDIQWLAQLPRTANGKVDTRALLARAPSLSRAPYAAPSGHVEQVLAALWQELLEVEVIGRDDDFFALGGHSLLVVRMTARLRTLLGVEVPVNVIFQHPTLAQLAEQVARPGQDEALVTLNAGEPKQPPLFCLHQPAGGVQHYLPMLAGLPAQLPVHGICLPAALREQDLVNLASHYVTLVREVQTQGPYRLAGWSMGGLLALELARQLEAQGETVAWLGLFDTTFHAEDQTLEHDALLGLLAMELDGESRQRLSKLAPHCLAELRSHTSGQGRVAQLRYALLHWAGANGLVLQAPLVHVEHTLAVMADARRWVSGYAPPQVAATLQLWWAEHTLVERPALPAEWDALSLRTCHYEVPADHESILGHPSFHEQLQRSLASVRMETVA
ncbi:amino acid adenylation domain-containing protein [Pseudomonas putida]|uniref:non-ribosomal peptide synthetase n=1 Tax=Pseudomonas putida TaxID=303 RepID=UPI0018A8A17A|nr:non-ribosomal peptide synthetase [Pseudomonas putida]MBF8669937.1 amino acid adenylation domain-containing protein [Pseudomonas putida]MBF8712665.1 amino acid adenylation domain-containing protein [Pseudomonas putida]